jgi:hypothetical protein
MTTSSLIEMHNECLNGSSRPGTPMNEGMPPPARISLLGNAVELDRGHARPDLGCHAV